MDGRNHPAELPDSRAPCTRLRQSYRLIVGKELKLTVLVSPADMQQLMNIEPRTLTLLSGPGIIYQAHTDDESVPINELVRASAVIADFILDWCGGTSYGEINNETHPGE